MQQWLVWSLCRKRADLPGHLFPGFSAAVCCKRSRSKLSGDSATHQAHIPPQVILLGLVLNSINCGNVVGKMSQLLVAPWSIPEESPSVCSPISRLSSRHTRLLYCRLRSLCGTVVTFSACAGRELANCKMSISSVKPFLILYDLLKQTLHPGTPTCWQFYGQPLGTVSGLRQLSVKGTSGS